MPSIVLVETVLFYQTFNRKIFYFSYCSIIIIKPGCNGHGDGEDGHCFTSEQVIGGRTSGSFVGMINTDE